MKHIASVAYLHELTAEQLLDSHPPVPLFWWLPFYVNRILCRVATRCEHRHGGKWTEE